MMSMYIHLQYILLITFQLFASVNPYLTSTFLYNKRIGSLIIFRFQITARKDKATFLTVTLKCEQVLIDTDRPWVFHQSFA